MTFCPTGCTDIELLGRPENPVCSDLPIRKNAVARFGLFKCSTAIPNPLTCATLSTMIGNGSIVFTESIANVTFGEPQFETQKLSDCAPPLRIVAQRSVNFDDKIAVKIAAIPPDGEDPGTPANNFYDRDFWGNKRQMAMQMRYLIVTCDGYIEVPRDDDGNPLQATLTVYRDMERTSVGDDESIVEVKRVQIDFKGDPLMLKAPEVNLNDSTCDSVRPEIM